MSPADVVVDQKDCLVLFGQILKICQDLYGKDRRSWVLPVAEIGAEHGSAEQMTYEQAR